MAEPIKFTENELKEINDEKIKFETLVNENKDKSELIDNERNKVIENFKEYFNSSKFSLSITNGNFFIKVFSYGFNSLL